MQIRTFHEPRTDTFTYVVFPAPGGPAAIIDPVLDYDPATGRITDAATAPVMRFVAEHDLSVRFLLETHAHADHLSGAQVLKARWPQAVLAIGDRITTVQATFRERLGLPPDFPTDGRQFDRLLGDGERVEADGLAFEVLPTPGHTPACVSYHFPDAVFTGDALFMPDMGTGRCDFPGGSAGDLYRSVQGLYRLPEATRVFVGHDYRPGGRETAWESTIGEERAHNAHLRADTSAEAFLAFRTQRDAGLAPPRLLFQSLQVNLAGGRLPPPGPGGRRHLLLPLELDAAPDGLTQA